MAIQCFIYIKVLLEKGRNGKSSKNGLLNCESTTSLRCQSCVYWRSGINVLHKRRLEVQRTSSF